MDDASLFLRVVLLTRLSLATSLRWAVQRPSRPMHQREYLLLPQKLYLRDFYNKCDARLCAERTDSDVVAFTNSSMSLSTNVLNHQTARPSDFVLQTCAFDPRCALVDISDVASTAPFFAR